MGAGVSCNRVTMGRAMVAVLAVLWLGACTNDKAKPVAQVQPAAAPAAEPVYVPVELYSPLGAYLAGRLAHNDGDGEAATKYLMRALEHDPNNADLLRQAFVAALSQGTMTEAIEVAKRLTDITPSSSVAGLTLVIDAMLRGNYNAAEERLSVLSTQGYNTLLVPMVGAWVAVGQNKPAVAIDLLSALEDNDAFAVFHDFHLALINDLAGNRDAAARAYKAAIDGQRGGSYRTVYAYGAFLERRGDTDAALALYGYYQAANPDSVWFEAAIARAAVAGPVDAMVRDARDGAAEALFGVSSALLQENVVEAAIVYALLAVHLRSGFDAGYMLLGEILEGLEEPDSAIEAYEHVSRQSPLSWTVRLKIADNLDMLDRVDEAVTTLRALAAERPNRTDPLIALADLLRGKEHWLESVAAYDEAFARIDELSRRHWRSLYARGIALERSRQWARAEADFLTALDLVPDQPFVLNYLGYSWVDQGVHLVRALDMIERAVDLRPNDGYIIDSLGWAHYRMGNFEDAVLHLERAIELRADDPTINDHLGDAYWKVGRRNEARFQWRRALTLGPDEEGMEADIREKIKYGLVPSPVADGGS